MAPALAADLVFWSTVFPLGKVYDAKLATSTGNHRKGDQAPSIGFYLLALQIQSNNRIFPLEHVSGCVYDAAMDQISQAFLAEIESFLAESRLDPTTLGKQALGDPSFVFDLRKGRSPSARTMEKLRRFMTALDQQIPGSLARDVIT